MKSIYVVLTLILLISNVNHSAFAQDVAIFSTDTIRFWGKSKKFMERINQQVWYINGTEMRYGSETIRIQPNSNKLDTILFQRSPKEHFDTIICNIEEPYEYRFYFNECCGGFNLKNETINSFPRGKVQFKTIGKTSGSYLGKIGDSGTSLISEKTDTIRDYCKSAMAPNVDLISIWRIEECDSSDNDCAEICIEEKDQNEINNFKVLEIRQDELIQEFLYLPLDETPLKILFDTNQKSVVIDTKE